MTEPLWKRILSYFFEWHIESASSEHNPHLYVSLKRGRYQLCTANAVYSYGDLYDNFLQAFRKMKLDELAVENVLLLGFGLGSIPFMLEKVFHKSYRYTALEIDEAVLYLANKYVIPDLESPIELVSADAFAFVMQCPHQYDMICMDIFLDDKVPAQFEGVDFLKKLRGLLKPQGVLMYNRLAVTEEDSRQAREFFENQFKKVFSQGVYLDVGSNWMLFNSPF